MESAIFKLDDLHAAEYNPRKQLAPGDADYERLKNSITDFGLVEPIIVNKRNNVIVGGHQRYAILKAMGETETEAVVVDLDDTDEKTLNIALNKIEGEWDSEKLKELLSELSVDEVIKTSFDKTEIDDLLKEIRKEEEAATEKVEQPEETSEESEEETPEDESQKGFEFYLSFPTQEAAEKWLRARNIEPVFSESRSITLVMEEVETHAIS